jgi:predicted nucleic-acid-binding protein
LKLVDTNIFLEILLQQKKSEIAKGILRELIETNEPFIITSFTIHSIIVILEKRRMINDPVDLVGHTFPKALVCTIYSFNNRNNIYILTSCYPESFRKGVFQQSHK